MYTAGTDTYLTLCAGCGTVVQLTPEQAVIAEAERVALAVVSLAFCPRCREAVRR